MKKRRRFKQTTTLAERLAQEAERLRAQARALRSGPERNLLSRKLRQIDAALDIDQWLTAPSAYRPVSLMALIDENRRRRPPTGGRRRTKRRHDTAQHEPDGLRS